MVSLRAEYDDVSHFRFRASAILILVTGLLVVYFVQANRRADRNLKVLEESPDFRYTL